MHMEALDRSFSTGSDGVMTLSSYPPLTPEPPLTQYNDCLQPQTQTQYSDCLHPQTQTQYSDCLHPQTQTQYSDCLQPQYSPVHYDDNYEHHRYDSLTSSPLSTSTPTPLDTPLHSSSYRTPLLSMSSYSSDSSCPLSTSQSSGLSEMPAISDMSISSDPCSSTSSLFLDQQSAASYNPFSVNNTRSAVRRGRKSGCASATLSLRSQDFNDSDVPRRSSAPARGVTTSSSLCPTSNSTSQVTTRKDSFVYDVQLESDNVLLFVPDLDLVKSHLMFAVREEVDVLKERIGELMERINHLEYENTVLRKYATQEALQQIQQQHGGAPNP